MLPQPFPKRPTTVLLRRLIYRGAALCLIIGSGVETASWAQSGSAVSLAQAEARRRAIQVNQAADEIQRGYQLIDERKAADALTVFSVTYEALPNIPLAQEHRLAARNGYVVAGCLRAQELASKGDVEGARKLIEKLLSPDVAPNDARALALQKRLADPDRFPPALTEKHVGNVEAVQALLLKANSFLELGDPDKAISTYQNALRIDPTNSAARRGMEKAEQEKQRYYRSAYDHQRSKMLSEVAKSWEESLPLKEGDVSALFGASAKANAYTQSGSESITKKLRSMILPNVEFSGVTLEEVVELLRVRSRDLDPVGKGISFIISVPPEARGKTISLNLSNVPMEEVLRYVSEMCGVTYKVDEHAVLFVSLSERSSAIISRSFRVPPDFIQNAPAPDAGAAVGDPFAAQTPAGGGIVIRRMGAKEFLEARGVTFPEGTSANYNSSNSTLTVRNTLANMEIIEMFVEQATKSAPKMAVITVRMLEVNQTNLEELGFDWLLGGAGMNGNNVFVGGGTAGNGNAFSPANFPFSTPYTAQGYTYTPPPAAAAVSPIFPFPVLVPQPNFTGFPNLPVTGALAGPLPTGTTAPFPYGGGSVTSGLRSGSYAVPAESIDSLLHTGAPVSGQQVAPGVLSLAGVFTDPQFQTVLRGLSQKKGVDVNASPSVTTKNGLKATVEITREFIYPTEFDPPQLPQGGGGGGGRGGFQGPMIATPTTPTAFEMRKTGVQLEVEPVISEDGRTVELTISPELTEFEGFVNYGSPIYRPTSQSVLSVPFAYFGLPLVIVPPLTPTVYVSNSYVNLSQPEQLITPNIILQPIFKSQKVSTGVKVWDGATVVLGSAKVQKRTKVEDKLPVLGDLPFVGRFFRSNVEQTNTKNIIIFVTVQVVDPSGRRINHDTAAVTR